MSNGNLYAQTGFCYKAGKYAPAYVGLAVGGAVLVVTSLSQILAPPEVPITDMMPLNTRLLFAGIFGGAAAMMTYFTCAGVSRGIRVSRA